MMLCSKCGATVTSWRVVDGDALCMRCSEGVPSYVAQIAALKAEVARLTDAERLLREAHTRTVAERDALAARVERQSKMLDEWVDSAIDINEHLRDLGLPHSVDGGAEFLTRDVRAAIEKTAEKFGKRSYDAMQEQERKQHARADAAEAALAQVAAERDAKAESADSYRVEMLRLAGVAEAAEAALAAARAEADRLRGLVDALREVSPLAQDAVDSFAQSCVNRVNRAEAVVAAARRHLAGVDAFMRTGKTDPSLWSFADDVAYRALLDAAREPSTEGDMPSSSSAGASAPAAPAASPPAASPSEAAASPSAPSTTTPEPARCPDCGRLWPEDVHTCTPTGAKHRVAIAVRDKAIRELRVATKALVRDVPIGMRDAPSVSGALAVLRETAGFEKEGG